MIDDATLLRRYARENAEDAFAELVRRHLDLVYSAALRQLNGDTHLAADAAQLVFTDLARKAGSLIGHPVLAGWLFTSTRFAAAKLVRTEQRRRHREQAAHAMNEILPDAPPALDWTHASPLIDEALAGLNTTDRDAVLLRFFQGRAFADIGKRLNLSENAARMRVDRALDKLRGTLARHGITSTSAALATALASHAVASAPVALAATVTSAGLVSASGGLVATFVTLMSTSKLPLGVAGALAIAGGAGLVYQADANARLRETQSALQQQATALPGLRTEHEQLARAAAEVADLRHDDAEFARLAAEAEALRQVLAERQKAANAAAAAARTAALASATQGYAPPQPKRQSAPTYPSALRAAGVEGEVMIDVVVDSQGLVTSAKAASSKLKSPAGTLDESDPTTAVMREALEKAAIEAVNKWEFVPGVAQNRVVNTRLTIPIVFTLASARTAEPGDPRKAAERVWF